MSLFFDLKRTEKDRITYLLVAMSLHAGSSSPNRHLCHPIQDPKEGRAPLLIRPALTPTEKIPNIHT